VKPQNFVIAAVVVASLALVTAAGCSDDDEAAAGFHCPTVGEKNCKNDPGATQVDVDSCKQCESQNKAYFDCLGGKPACGAADGKSEPIDLKKCPTELQTLITCVQGGTTSSSSGGSSDAGGGG